MFRVDGDWLYSLNVVFGCDVKGRECQNLHLVGTLFHKT